MLDKSLTDTLAADPDAPVEELMLTVPVRYFNDIWRILQRTRYPLIEYKHSQIEMAEEALSVVRDLAYEAQQKVEFFIPVSVLEELQNEYD